MQIRMISLYDVHFLCNRTPYTVRGNYGNNRVHTYWTKEQIRFIHNVICDNIFCHLHIQSHKKSIIQLYSISSRIERVTHHSFFNQFFSNSKTSRHCYTLILYSVSCITITNILQTTETVAILIPKSIFWNFDAFIRRVYCIQHLHSLIGTIPMYSWMTLFDLKSSNKTVYVVYMSSPALTLAFPLIGPHTRTYTYGRWRY